MSNKTIIIVISLVAILSYFAGCQLAVQAKAVGPQTPTTPQKSEHVFPLPSRYPLTTTYYDSIRHDGSVRVGRRHWDIACPVSTPVLSPCDGTILQVGYWWDIGNHVYVRDDDGYTHRLGHFRALNSFLVLSGQRVKAGQAIGYSGGDDAGKGHSSGPHLHWQIFDPNGVPVNPLDYLKR